MSLIGVMREIEEYQKLEPTVQLNQYVDIVKLGKAAEYRQLVDFLLKEVKALEHKHADLFKLTQPEKHVLTTFIETFCMNPNVFYLQVCNKTFRWANTHTAGISGVTFKHLVIASMLDPVYSKMYRISEEEMEYVLKLFCNSSPQVINATLHNCLPWLTKEKGTACLYRGIQKATEDPTCEGHYVYKAPITAGYAGMMLNTKGVELLKTAVNYSDYATADLDPHVITAEDKEKYKIAYDYWSYRKIWLGEVADKNYSEDSEDLEGGSNPE